MTVVEMLVTPLKPSVGANFGGTFPVVVAQLSIWDGPREEVLERFE